MRLCVKYVSCVCTKVKVRQQQQHQMTADASDSRTTPDRTNCVCTLTAVEWQLFCRLRTSYLERLQEEVAHEVAEEFEPEDHVRNVSSDRVLAAVRCQGRGRGRGGGDEAMDIREEDGPEECGHAADHGRATEGVCGGI